MIGVYFKGRMGNQLFQFAFYRYLKMQKPGSFVFFANPRHSYISKYFELGSDNYLLDSFAYAAIAKVLPKIIHFKEHYSHNFFAPREISPAENTVYHGYYQTDFYLKRLGGNFDIRVKSPYLRSFEGKFGDLFSKNKTVVVHIRRTDYLSYGKRDISLPISFFKDQLYGINELDSYKVIFVSDDMNFVKQEFPLRENFIYSEESEIIDFLTIQHADIAIISNSTFAWWACYLSPKKQRVLAPSKWIGIRIGREHPRGIMTDRFEWREVKIDPVK